MSQYEVVINQSSTSGTAETVFILRDNNPDRSMAQWYEASFRYGTYVIPNGYKVVSAKLSSNIGFNATNKVNDSRYSPNKQALAVIRAGSKSHTRSRSIGGSTDVYTAEISLTEEEFVSWNKQVSYTTGVNDNNTPGGTFYYNPGVPASVLQSGQICADLSLGGTMILTLTVEHADPIITNLSTQGEFWERPINVSWRSEHQEGYEYECYYNNVKVSEGNGTTATTFTIPANTFSGTLGASVRIRLFNTRPDGVKVYSEWIERSITLKDITATITNLLVNGENWEKPIAISWQSTDQEQFKLEVYKENIIVYTQTGTTATAFTIPADTLMQGNYVIKVTVAYQNRYVNSASKNVTLRDVMPAISSVSLSGSNIDYDLTLSWISTDQQTYEVTIYKENTLVDTKTGTAEKTLLFLHNTLTIGSYTFKVRVAYKDRWSDYKSFTTNLVETKPSIGALEPDRIVKKQDEDIHIWWTSTNQTKWNIVVDVTGATYAGTNEKELILPPNTLTVGKHSFVLIVTHVTSAGVEKSVSKSAEFLVNGKPPVPTITSTNQFNTNIPVIEWDTQEQQGYLVEIMQDDNMLWTSNWRNGLITRQEVGIILNDGNYTVRVKIINQFSVESDYAIQNISIVTDEPTEIILTATVLDKYVSLLWDTVNDVFEKFCIYRNNELIHITTSNTYDDYTAIGDVDYKIVGLNYNNVAKASNVEYKTLNINGCVIACVNQLFNMLDVGKITGSYSFKMQSTQDNTNILCTGRDKPITVFGEHTTNNYTISFVDYGDYFDFVTLANKRQIMCYRDRRQKLFLSVNNFEYSHDGTMAEYTVPLIEVSYNEVMTLD